MPVPYSMHADGQVHACTGKLEGYMPAEAQNRVIGMQKAHKRVTGMQRKNKI
jgi:hypothetical protein